MNAAFDTASEHADALALLEDAFSGIDFGMALLDEDLNFVLFNEKYSELSFHDAAQPVIGENAAEMALKQFQAGVYVMPADTMPDQMIAGIIDAVRNCLAVIEFKRTDGRFIKASSKRTQLGGYLITVSDDTERKHAEATEKARWQAVTDAVGSLDEGFSLWDSEMRFIMCNDTYMRIVAPHRDTPFRVGDRGEDVFAEAFRAGHHVLPADITEEKFVSGNLDWARSHSGQIENVYTDGRVVVATAQKTALGGVLVTARDVTEERNSDARARDMLLDAFQALDEGLMLCDENMNFVFANDAWKRMNFEGQEDRIPCPGDSVLESLMQQVKDGFYVIPDGMTESDYIGWVLSEMAEHGEQAMMSTTDGRHFIGSSHLTAFGGSLLFVRDVTKQRQAEDARLRAVNDALDAVDEPLVLFTAERQFALANTAWLDMVRGYVDPDPGQSVESVYKALLDAGFYSIPDDVSIEKYLNRFLKAVFAFQSGFELCLHDNRVHLSSSRQTALGGFLLSFRDITDQKQAESELAEQREIAHQNEKLSALGELLAGVAHELNNPLSVVFGYSQMLQGKIDDPVMSERVDLICQSSERAAKIVRTFLAMARQRPTKMEACSVNDIVETALEVSSYSLKSNGTTVDVALDETAPEVMGDFDQLAQVFSNLIVNAGHAVGPKGADGKIMIRGRSDKGQIVIEIADNGNGIPADIQSRIFEPFFTTKDVGEGTGIGLAFSHRIVESHAGTLSVKSNMGHGTQFYVRLQEQSAQRHDTVEHEFPAAARRRVLVLDDEDGVAQLISDMLTEEGYLVTKMTNPNQALQLAEATSFDVILSDFKMPQMNGEVFFRALEATSPNNAKRVGFITGDAMSAQVLRFLSESKCPHIEKPIMRSELLSLIKATAGEDQ